MTKNALAEKEQERVPLQKPATLDDILETANDGLYRNIQIPKYPEKIRGNYGQILDNPFNHFDLCHTRKPLKQGMPGLQGVNYGFNLYEVDDSLNIEGTLQVAIHERGHNTRWNERDNRNYVNTLFGYNVEPGYYQGD